MIECIPNFSEGRRPEVIAAIVGAVRAVAGAHVLDTHIDPDHNRSVVTFAGEAGPVAEAAFRAVEAAALLIDMNEHRGQHPRIGATDVLPFVPLRGATLGQCVKLARAVGWRIAEALEIPIYLYGAAAERPERRELPALRKGEFEGLRASIATDPARAPDAGPRRLGTAGATVVGAREPLIAYNLFLNTDDLALAKRIARAVRGSSGGLRGVRALGMLVGGRAQVSMNLVDYRHTPVHRVVDMVAREAAVYGVSIAAGELVGLIPEDALVDAGRVGLRLPDLGNDQILERQLAHVIASEPSARSAAGGRRTRRTDVVPLRLNSADSPTLAQFPALDEQLDQIWQTSVRALAAAVHEQEHAPVGARVQAMLRVLGRDLLVLAEAERTADLSARVQSLLLLARRAVKAAESLTAESGDALARNRNARLAYLSHTVAVATRLRAQPIVALLDDPQRSAIEQEFVAYTRQARDMLAKADSVA